MQLLGREYYQTNFGEKYLVLGPITVHALAGISKRLFLLSTSPLAANRGVEAKAEDKSVEPTPGSTTSLLRPLTSLLSLTGYATALYFLPIHFFVHRDYPALPNEPIYSVGPSSLDFEYVKYGLHTWPWRSWFLYAGLVGSAALHAADGAVLMYNTFKGTWGGLSRKTRRTLAIGGVVLPVILGLVGVAREPPMIMSFLENRYKVAYMQSNVFRT